MNTKRIEFTQEQFHNLIHLVYLGRWMTTSFHDDEDSSLENIEQHIYAQAKNFGLENWVDFDDESQKFFPSEELEEVLEPVIQDYDDHTFWDELAWQLAERDFSRKYDQAQVLVMTEDEIFREKNAIADKYFNELSEHGIDNFVFGK